MNNPTTDKINYFVERDFGQVISVSIDWYRKNFKPLFKVLLNTVGPVVLLAAIFGGLNQANAATNPGENPIMTGIIGVVLYFGSIIFNIIAHLMVMACTFAYVKLYSEKDPEDITPGEVWSLAKSIIMSLLGANIVVGILAIIGALFCIIPGIYVAVILSLTTWVLFWENQSLGDAMSTSRRLVDQNWWATFGVSFILALIAGVVGLLLTIPAVVLTTLTMVQGGEANTFVMVLIALFAGAGSFVSLMLYSLYHAGMGFQYFSLKEQKDGTGMMDEISSVNQENTGGFANEGDF